MKKKASLVQDASRAWRRMAIHPHPLLNPPDQGFSTFFICVPLHTLITFCVSPGFYFLNPGIPIIFCIPLCYIFYTLELFAYPMKFFAYPLGLKYPRLRNPALDQTIWAKKNYFLEWSILRLFSALTSSRVNPAWMEVIF